jgi:Sulfotransferase family
MRIGLENTGDELLRGAYASYLGERGADGPSAPMREMLGRYDLEGMENAVSICFWGRSGSWLLQSYLDSHEDVLILPKNGTHMVYPFLAEYGSLSIWEKLIAYPAYSESREGPDGVFLKGEFSVAAADYYAAVHALHAIHGDRPAAWLNTRARFLQFLHLAHAAAAGRRGGSPRPLLVLAQHWTNDDVARRFIEDFPNGRYIHTIRDPISALDSWYDWQVKLQAIFMGLSPETQRSFLGPISAHYLDPAGQAVRTLLRSDRPHAGMQARTRAVRFEDLHRSPEATMRRVAEWLGIAFRPSLLESTFNGVPYVNESGGASWVGANPANAGRRSKRLSGADRLMMFTLLQENFREWHYDCPAWARPRLMRLAVILALLLLPTKMELLNARLVLQSQVLPALKKSRIGYASGAPLYLIMRRLVMMTFIASQAGQRLSGKRRLLTPI